VLTGYTCHAPLFHITYTVSPLVKANKNDRLTKGLKQSINIMFQQQIVIVNKVIIATVESAK
jgi:hypothetical protein